MTAATPPACMLIDAIVLDACHSALAHRTQTAVA
jgi:hypothetical protein